LTKFTAKNRQREEERALAELRESLSRTQVGINQAYALFNASADPDLVESYVYEINALQARYSYLLRQVKAMEAREVG